MLHLLLTTVVAWANKVAVVMVLFTLITGG